MEVHGIKRIRKSPTPLPKLRRRQLEELAATRIYKTRVTLQTQNSRTYIKTTNGKNCTRRRKRE